MDKKTKKRLKYIRYLFVLIVSLAIMFVAVELMNEFDGITLLIVVGMMAAVFALAQVADKICGYILFHTFGFNFIEYVEEKGKKK